MIAHARPIVEPAQRDKKIFCFGYGYTASFLSERLRPYGWTVAGTTTDAEKRDFMRKNGVDAFLFDQHHALGDPRRALEGVTHVLFSIPPGAEGDLAFHVHGEDIAAIQSLEWAGYLSTIAVYGNQDGNWIDEETPPAPSSRRGSLRLKAEQQWHSLLSDGLPLHIFRLAGIYGPGRTVIDAVRAGTARRIDKPGHVFNRIHVEDIVQALIASMNHPHGGAVYNLSDDEPSPSDAVITFACDMLGIVRPPLVPFDQCDVAPIVRSFYKDNKRVRNARLRDELGVDLLYPDYRSGMRACFALEAKALEFLKFSGSDP